MKCASCVDLNKQGRVVFSISSTTRGTMWSSGGLEPPVSAPESRWNVKNGRNHRVRGSNISYPGMFINTAGIASPGSGAPSSARTHFTSRPGPGGEAGFSPFSGAGTRTRSNVERRSFPPAALPDVERGERRRETEGDGSQTHHLRLRGSLTRTVPSDGLGPRSPPLPQTFRDSVKWLIF